MIFSKGPKRHIWLTVIVKKHSFQEFLHIEEAYLEKMSLPGGDKTKGEEYNT